jgi:hypothetical protein
MLFIENNNGKFDTEDFKVFYLAAKALFSGEQVYGISFGLDTGYYKYSPFILIVLSSYTLFTFKIASIIHFFLTVFSAIFSIIILEQLIAKYLFKVKKQHIYTSLLILLSVLLHFVRDLHMGNVNIILLFLMILALKFSLESKEIAAGILIALVILTKPYFIILGIPFLIFKKHKTVFSIAISGISLTLLTATILGFSTSLNLHLDWFKAMLEHSDYLYSPYTVTYLLDYYLGLALPKNIDLPLFGLITLLVSAYFYKISRTETLIEHNKSLVFSFFILIGIIPNLLITDVEHFLFSLPLISIVILYLQQIRKYYWTILFIIVIFIYGGNSSDLVGNDLSLKIKFWGFVGIGNLMIICAAICIYLNRNEWGKSELGNN